MNSGVSAYLGGKLGLGNQVTTNSSACTTGAESILMAYERIKSGLANRMLAGSTSADLIFGVVLMPCVSVLLNIIRSREQGP
jgi:3-oxoacyl-(acyl-carrier-protein) synthase